MATFAFLLTCGWTTANLMFRFQNERPKWFTAQCFCFPIWVRWKATTEQKFRQVFSFDEDLVLKNLIVERHVQPSIHKIHGLWHTAREFRANKITIEIETKVVNENKALTNCLSCRVFSNFFLWFCYKRQETFFNVSNHCFQFPSK